MNKETRQFTWGIMLLLLGLLLLSYSYNDSKYLFKSHGDFSDTVISVFIDITRLSLAIWLAWRGLSLIEKTL